MYHLIVSFREGTTRPGAAGAIERGMAETLGLGDHQRLSVVHGDTDHLHLHLAISKIHPTTFRMVEPYRDHYALSAACRQFEQAFGLQVDNGIPNGERLTAQAGDYRRTKASNPSNAGRRASRSSGSKRRSIGPMPRGHRFTRRLPATTLRSGRVVPGSWWWTATTTGCG